MCGLTALFRADGGPIDPDLLQRMTDAIRHRGPDGEGFHVAPGIGLGHRRLAIVDVAGGLQPMANTDGSAIIAFNGEIYNFPTLQPRLEALGHRFRTRCDTEAVLHAWTQWGPDCVQHLDGMFAFALWDVPGKRLFLARDRLGKKPLYYARMPSGWAIGSELAAFAAVPGISRRIDPRALDDYLAYGYVPDPATIFCDIRKLPAAHGLLLTQGDAAEPVPARYWRLDTTPSRIGEAEAVSELQSRLQAATSARLMSDVPLGAFLSGGVDSSGIVAFAARARAARGERPLDTFTIGFPGAETEVPYARLVAAHCGTIQHEEQVQPADIIAAAADQGRVFGEPFGDPSAIPTAAVCRLARRHVTVALSGDGGDEGFAGYRRYRWHQLVEGMRRWMPPGARRVAIGQLARAYPKLDRAPRWLRAKTTLTELSLDAASGYYRTLARVQDEQRRGLLAPALRAELAGHEPGDRIAALMQDSNSDDALVQAQYADVHGWLVGDILTKIDRTSMAASLEARAPLLDHRLLEWAICLPADLKLRRGDGKYVLKQALAPFLPAGMLDRPKQGFAVSLAAPLRQDLPRLRGRLLGPVMQDSGLFDMPAIARMVDAHGTGRHDHAHALWLLLVAEGFLAGIAAGHGDPAIAVARDRAA